jgi:AcrR family transcriptional regulator
MPHMLDLTNTRHKILDAALKLADERGWANLPLDAIANRAGIKLAEFRKEFMTKAQILSAFGRAVDDAVLVKITPADAELAPRDRLFDVLMTRFETMAPYKAGLKRIRDDLRFQPGQGVSQICIATRSLYWMMVAAGIDVEGARGAIRLPGLMGVYVRVFDTWLEDDDPGLARTMAALDSRLRRGERIFQRVDEFGETASGFCARLMSLKDRRRNSETPPAYDTATSQSSADTGSSGGNGNMEPGPAPAV